MARIKPPPTSRPCNVPGRCVSAARPSNRLPVRPGRPRGNTATGWLKHSSDTEVSVLRLCSRERGGSGRQGEREGKGRSEHSTGLESPRITLANCYLLSSCSHTLSSGLHDRYDTAERVAKVWGSPDWSQVGHESFGRPHGY